MSSGQSEKMTGALKEIIEQYERDILGHTYIILLEDDSIIAFSIEKENVPHLLGLRKLPIRQVQNRSAMAIYNMLVGEQITMAHIVSYKETYKKVLGFQQLTSVLHCGDLVRIVKRIGRLKSSYLLYLDRQPEEIIHLGLVLTQNHEWKPESILVQRQRDVTKYIDGQIPVSIKDIIIN